MTGAALGLGCPVPSPSSPTLLLVVGFRRQMHQKMGLKRLPPLCSQLLLVQVSHFSHLLAEMLGRVKAPTLSWNWEVQPPEFAAHSLGPGCSTGRLLITGSVSVPTRGGAHGLLQNHPRL